jgi:hypothetical protein
VYSNLLSRGSVALVLAVLLAGIVLPAAAYAPGDQNQRYEILLPAYDIEGYKSPVASADRSQAEALLSARYGGAWNVHSWNPQSGTARWVYGKSVQVSGAITSEAQVDQVARQVIAANQDVLRADGSDLRLTATPHVSGKWAAHYQQTWHGYDVLGATVRLVFTDRGTLMLMGSDFQPNINLSPVPVVSEAQAVDIAKSGVPFNSTVDRIEGGVRLCVLPVSLSANQVEYRLVYEINVRTSDPVGLWKTHVDAHSGQVVQRTNEVCFAYGGTTMSPTYTWNYCEQTLNLVIPFLTINVSGVGSTTSDGHGNWTIAGSGGSRTVTANLIGPYVNVHNLGGSSASFSGTAQENIALQVRFDNANSQMDERVVFESISDVHSYYATFAPTFHYTNTLINAYVRRAGTCNAYWDGTINFYAQGGGCANTGEMRQVVHHEFCHGISNEILGGQGTEGIGEGNSDILGNLITQDPVVGRGFYLNNCTSGIRNSLNTLVYPDDVVGQEIHTAGQVIAGFNWDEMVLLQAQYGDSVGTWYSGKIWHEGRVLLHPQNQPDQVLATFTADDDNGNLDDGTPNYDAICQAATNHGFACPEVLVGVFVYHTARPYAIDPTHGYQIVASAVSLPEGQAQIVASSVRTHYRVNGGSFVDLPMTTTGIPGEYTGTIPAQVYGSVVEYYITAANTLGNTGSSPRNAPTELHYFQVNNDFVDQAETTTSWVIGQTGDDAALGIWVREDPVGTTYGSPAVQVQPEDDHTDSPGHICFITGNGAVGGAAGVNDVDGGKTTLLSPRFDLTGATSAVVSYWKWYSDDQGNSPNQDYWQVDITNDNWAHVTSLENTTTSTHAWVQQTYNILDSFPTPGVVQLRFIAQDYSPGTLVEGGVDDFELVAVFPTVDVDSNFNVRVTGLAQNRPNPFNPITEITFRLAQPGPATLAIYDASGRQIRNLASGQRAAGEHRVIWNGTDENGHGVPSGTYFCKLNAGGKSYSARMVLLK